MEFKIRRNKQFYIQQFNDDINTIYNLQDKHLANLLKAHLDPDAEIPVSLLLPYNERLKRLKDYLKDYIEFNTNPRFFGTMQASAREDLKDSHKDDYRKRWNQWIKQLIEDKALQDFLDVIPRTQMDYPPVLGPREVQKGTEFKMVY